MTQQDQTPTGMTLNPYQAIELYRARGDLAKALEICDKALAAEPDNANLHLYQADIYRLAHKYDIALKLCESLIKDKPDFTAAIFQKAFILYQAHYFHEAMKIVKLLEKRDPECIQTLLLHCDILIATKEYNKAFKQVQTIFKTHPGNIEALYRMTLILRHLGKYQAALTICDSALDKKKDDVNFFLEKALLLQLLNHHHQARRLYSVIITHYPSLQEARYLYGTLLLQMGEFNPGWQYYEARLECQYNQSLIQLPSSSRWQGEPLNNKTLLLHCEEGYGNTLQFIRYVKYIKKKNSSIIVYTQPKLVELLETLPEIDSVIPAGKKIPDFDFHLPLLSLPLLFHTEIDNIPNKMPYLHAPELKHRSLLKMLKNDQFKVGLCWKGKPSLITDNERSIDIKLLKPLFKLQKEFAFYSFQFDLDDTEQQHLSLNYPLHDVTPFCHNFLKTAEVLQHMNLVISVDTAIAHLAAALQVPVWLLLTSHADWRWLLKRNTSPWYPEMKLIRQRHTNEWKPVIDEVMQLAETLAKSKHH